MGFEPTIHNVFINADGTPSELNIGNLTQGSKNVDIIRVRFENFDDTQELVCVLKAERDDGKKAPAKTPPGLLLTPNKIDDVVYYDFLIGQQEVEQEGIGSWFTAVAGELTLNVALMDNEQIKVKSQFKMEVEPTVGFEEGAEYNWDIIEGFLQALTLRPTYDYVDNIDSTLNSLIEANQIAITDLENNKIDKDIITNLSIETDAEKEDYMIIQNDGESEVKRIKLEDIKELVTKVKTVNNVEPDSGTTNITLIAENIPSNDGNLQTDIDFSKSEDVRIENKFDGEVVRLDDDLDDAIYFDKSEEEEDPLMTVVNADKLNQKEEENLDVNSAKNVTEQIDSKNITDIFEENGTTVKNATDADNANQLNNKNEEDLNVSSADNATLSADSTKVYNKTEAQLKEAMQDGTFDRIKLLENTSIGTSPTTLDEELKDGDMLEIRLKSQSGGYISKPLTLFYIYSSINNDFEYNFISEGDLGNILIGDDTVYFQSAILENKKISFPSSTTVTNEGLTDWKIGNLSLSSTGFTFAGGNNIDVETIYAWRKKESE